jgi:hypothetical protein
MSTKSRDEVMSPRKDGFLDRMRDFSIEMRSTPDDHLLSFVPYVGSYLLPRSDAVYIIRELKAYADLTSDVEIELENKEIAAALLAEAERRNAATSTSAIAYLWGVAKRISSRLEERGGEL